MPAVGRKVGVSCGKRVGLSLGAAIGTGVTVPDAPVNVEAVAGDEEATITWEAGASDGGSPVTLQTVYVEPGGHEEEVDGETFEVVVTGLTNDTEYTAYVVATNAIGDSEPSAESDPFTPEAPPASNPSYWYASGLDLDDIPFTAAAGAFVECEPPVTTSTTTVDDGGALTGATLTPGAHITVESGTDLGDVTIIGDNIRITCESDVTFGQIGFSSHHCWIEGAASGTRTAFVAPSSFANIVSTFMAEPHNLAFTSIDWDQQNAAGGNNIMGFDRCALVGCRFRATQSNITSTNNDTLIADCNFYTDDRWNFRDTDNSLKRNVIIDCQFDQNGTAYGCVRLSGDGWWVHENIVNSGIELALESGHVINDVWVDGNDIYNSTSFAAGGTLDNIHINGNTFHEPGWDEEEDIETSMGFGEGATNLFIGDDEPNVFLEDSAAVPAWGPPGNPETLA